MIYDRRLDRQLAPEIRRAIDKLESLASKCESRDEVSRLHEALKVVRSLNHPHRPSVHRMIQALLLLYDVDEYETRVRSYDGEEISAIVCHLIKPLLTYSLTNLLTIHGMSGVDDCCFHMAVLSYPGRLVSQPGKPAST